MRKSCLLFAILTVLATPASAFSNEAYAFLAGSSWFVPPGTLPAMLFVPSTGATIPVTDQTVWQISSYKDGYFTGNTVAQFRNVATGKLVGSPGCMHMVGSVTPAGDVLISFVDKGATSAAGATTGVGKLALNPAGQWQFTMQMASGTSALVAHWSYMNACKAGEACESRLPGTSKSLAEFLAMCGF